MTNSKTDKKCEFQIKGYCRPTLNYRGVGFCLIKDIENGSLFGYVCNKESKECPYNILTNTKKVKCKYCKKDFNTSLNSKKKTCKSCIKINNSNRVG